MRGKLFSISVSVACCALAISGCSSDSGGDTATEAAATATGAAATATEAGATATEAGVDADPAADEATECEPVGVDMEGDAAQTVDVTLTDFAFNPVAIEVDAGIITFATMNEGGSVHEFAVLPGGGEVPFTEDGAPDEAALEAAGAFEMEGYGPGGTCNATWDLEPGEYTLFCIIEASDGETHYEKGMEGSLTVLG